jgi:hypothetical protein
MPSFPPGACIKGGANAAPVLAEMAREFYAPIIPVAVELRGRGLSLRDIARELEQRGIQPRLGCRSTWAAAQVRRILLRAGVTSTDGTVQDKVADQPTVPETAVPVSVACKSASPSSKGDIRLWICGRLHGPYSEEQVKAMLESNEVTLSNDFSVGLEAGRRLSELFVEVDDAISRPGERFRREKFRRR